MKLLLYCTKAKPMLKVAREDLFKPQDRARCYKQWEIKYFTKYVSEEMYEANGKIVAECDFEVEKINVLDCTFRTFNLVEKEILNKSCLTYHELFEYLKNRYNPRGYAIHIKNLHIFDEPRDIRNYYNIATRTMADCMNQKALLKAPQNMCNAYDVFKNHYVLISIRPKWLCKILNGEKTIEVRKKVLKEMLK